MEWIPEEYLSGSHWQANSGPSTWVAGNSRGEPSISTNVDSIWDGEKARNLWQVKNSVRENEVLVRVLKNVPRPTLSQVRRWQLIYILWRRECTTWDRSRKRDFRSKKTTSVLFGFINKWSVFIFLKSSSQYSSFFFTNLCHLCPHKWMGVCSNLPGPPRLKRPR